jgi:hypothetical protein
MALPSGGGKTSSAPAAPFTYPVYTKADFAAVPPTTKAPPSLAESLGTRASNQAHSDVASQVAGIQAQQAADRASAAEVARQIGLASRAAAGFLGPGGYNLGGLAAGDYARAVAQTQGLASGYTGQLQNDLAGQTEAGQNTLRAIPGNEQTLINRGGSLANTLYGLQGSLPGQALAAEGLAATTTARLLPSQFLATGQNEALQALAAGRTDARALDPQITAARADLPKLTQQYLGDLVSQQQKQQEMALAGAKAKADAIYKSAYLQHLQAGDTERVAHDRANEAAGVTYHDALLGLAQGRLDVSRQGAATARFNATTSRINANKPSAAARPSVSIQGDSTTGKYKVTTYPNGRTDVQRLPGRLGKPSARSSSSLSAPDLQKTISSANQAAKLAFNGGNYDKDGNPVPGGGYDKDGFPQPPVDRATAINEARAQGWFSSPQYAKIAMRAINRAYGRPGPGSAANLFGSAGQATVKRATTR